MKYARLALAALAAALVLLVLIATQPASGQSQPSSQNVAPPGYGPSPGYAPTGRGFWFNPYPNKLLEEEGNLERDTASLVQEYSRTEDEAQRGKTKVKLAETLQKQFDIQQKRRDLEVAAIETQLKKLREIMRKRAEARQTIIDKRLDQLLREADGLGWTPPHGTPAPSNVYGRPYQPQGR